MKTETNLSELINNVDKKQHNALNEKGDNPKNGMTETKFKTFETTSFDTKVVFFSIPGGYEIVKIKDILYFEYDKSKRQWLVHTLQNEIIILRRNSTSDDLLQIDPIFLQVNMRYVVNMQYLKAIINMECQMTVPVEAGKSFIVSRSYLKQLQERFDII